MQRPFPSGFWRKRAWKHIGGEISGYELRLMLGIPSRLELEAFLKTHGVYLEYTEEDLVHDAETSRQLKLKHAPSE